MNKEWRVVRTGCDDGALSIEDTDGITICELSFTGGDEELVARLIVAAPMLYNACQTHDVCPATTAWVSEGNRERKPRAKTEKTI